MDRDEPSHGKSYAAMDCDERTHALQEPESIETQPPRQGIRTGTRRGESKATGHKSQIGTALCRTHNSVDEAHEPRDGS